MTLLRVVTVFGRVLLMVVCTASGVYVLLYLWRWEWERAQIAGIFFIASLVVLCTQLVLRRIADVANAPLGAAPPQGTADSVAPLQPFAWTEPDQSTYIFLPVLLGFGVALSALAAAAERLVAFAVGGPHEGRTSGTGPVVSQRVLVILLASVLVLTGALIVVARERLMTQPESSVPGVRSYLLEVEGRQMDVDVADSIDALAHICRDRAHVDLLTIREVTVTSDDTGVLVVQPALGRHGTARFEGCLTDAVLDRRTVTLLDVQTSRSGDALTGSATSSGS